MDIEKFIDDVFLSLVAIGTTLTFIAMLLPVISSCEAVGEFTSSCHTFTAWTLSEAGFNSLSDAGKSFWTALRVCLATHFSLTFLGWFFYILPGRKITGLLTIAVAHVAGWVVLGYIVGEWAQVPDMLAALTGDDSLAAPTYGDAIIYSVAATTLQLLTVALVLYKDVLMGIEF